MTRDVGDDRPSATAPSQRQGTAETPTDDGASATATPAAAVLALAFERLSVCETATRTLGC